MSSREGDAGRTVWVVSELYHPEETSTGQVMTGIAEGLAARFSVKVLCGQPTYAARGTRAPRVEVRRGVGIHRCVSSTLDKNKLAPRLLNAVTLSVSIFGQALRRFAREDLVLVVTNPPLLPFLMAAACRMRGARCLLLIHDVYPEALVAAGLIRRGTLGERVLSAARNALYERMARIVTLGRDMSALVVARCPAVADRLVVIPNWADPDTVRPSPRAHNPVLARLGLTEQFVVQWAGNMGRTHAVEAVMAAAERCRGRGIHFLFVGAGAKTAWLEAEVARRPGANVTVLPAQPSEAWPAVLNACDVAVIAFVEGMAGVSVPSRVYNVLAAGKPLVAMVDPSTEVAHVIREEGVGWVVPVGDVAALTAAIEDARSDPAKREAMGRRARCAAEGKYSRAAVIARYVRLMEECSNR